MTLALTDARLFPAVAALNADLGTESVSADTTTLDLSCRTTLLTVSGTKAFTLPDPTGTPFNILGLRHRVQCVSAASTPLGTLTVTSPETTTGVACASTFTFTYAGQAVDFVWTGSKWRAERVQRGGVQTVVVGTTVLTGLNLAAVYALSVTGTVSSTTTKGLPNGSAPGEQVLLTNTVAASIPVGDISGTYTNLLGAAATSIGAIGVAATASAVGDSAILVWDGQSWACQWLSGVTFA